MPGLIRDITEERVRIPTPDGKLEGVLSYGGGEPRLSVLLAAPHPFMGGTLSNNVLRSLSTALAEAGHVCLRFNYRGVGESDGTPVDVLAGMKEFWECGSAPQDALLIEDTRFAAAWLEQNTGLPRVAVGYSFGSYAVTAADLGSLAGLVLILPTLTHHDFERARCTSVPKLVIYSSDDFATPPDEVERWLGSVSDPVRSVCVEGARHFFQRLETRVNEVCLSFLNEYVLREVHHGH